MYYKGVGTTTFGFQPKLIPTRIKHYNMNVLHHYWNNPRDTARFRRTMRCAGRGISVCVLLTCIMSSRLQGLTSGKQSLANTWSSAVFPHWLSPTTTILHFTLWLGSMLDFRDNFWHGRLSFIDLSRFLKMSPILGGWVCVNRREAAGLGASKPARLLSSPGVSACSEPVNSICLHL